MTFSYFECKLLLNEFSIKHCSTTEKKTEYEFPLIGPATHINQHPLSQPLPPPIIYSNQILIFLISFSWKKLACPVVTANLASEMSLCSNTFSVFHNARLAKGTTGDSFVWFFANTCAVANSFSGDLHKYRVRAI